MVDGLITVEVVDLIASRLEETERAVICGTAVAEGADATLKALNPGSRVRRIPASILADYRRTNRPLLRSREALPPVMVESDGSEAVAAERAPA